MYEVKTSLPPKTPYLDLVKSKEGAGEGGGRGGRYGNKHFSFYSYSSLLIFMCFANFGYYLQHF